MKWAGNDSTKLWSCTIISPLLRALVIWNQDHALANVVAGHCLQHSRGFVQWMAFHVRFEHHSAVQHQRERGRILLRRATPIATRGSIERHQIGEPQFHLLRCEPDDGQVSSMIEQSEPGGLSCWRPAGFEDFQPDAFSPGLFNERAHGGLQFLLARGTGIQRQRSAVLSSHIEPAAVDVNGHNCRTHGSSDLYAESAHSSHAHKYRYVIRP